MRIIPSCTISPLMLISLATLLATLSSIFLSRAALQLENLAVRHQTDVLRRSARKRPKLTSGDRLLWIRLSHLWRDWRTALAIVKPETVVAWHRAGFRLFWTWRIRRGQPASPVWSKISSALKRLGFRSRNFLVQLLSETSRAGTIRVRRSSLGRLWNDWGSHACLHQRNGGIHITRSKSRVCVSCDGFADERILQVAAAIRQNPCR